jgi:hypothetical protein
MLHSILGIACFDPHFRRALFENSTVAVRTYGIYVGEGDFIALKLMFADKSLLSFFEAINQGICYHPPCGPVPTVVLDIIGAALLDRLFAERLFTDPIIAAREKGFILHYPETYVLTSVVYGAKRDALRQAMMDLGGRITQMTERVAA